VGPTFWGGVLFGLGIGLFVPGILAELEIPKTVWLAFLAIVLIASGPAIAFRAVRRNWQPDKDKPQSV
jgi:hypothetical protein